MKKTNGLIEPLIIVSCGRRRLSLTKTPYWTKHSRVTSEKPYLILEFKICLLATHLTVKSQKKQKKLVENTK